MKIGKIKSFLIAIMFLLFLSLMFYTFIKLNYKESKKFNNDLDNETSQKFSNIQDRINKLDDNFYNLVRKYDELNLHFIKVDQIVNDLKNQTPEGRDNSIKIIINLYEIRRLGSYGKNFSQNLDILEKLTVSDVKLHDEVIKLFKYKDNVIIDSEIKNILFAEYSKVDLKPTEGNDNKLRKIFMNNIKIIKIEDLKNSNEFITKANEFISLRRYEDLLVLIKKNYADVQFSETIKMLEDKIEFDHILNEILDILYMRN